MRHFVFPALLAGVLVLPAASPAWARGGAPPGHAVPRGGAFGGHGHLPGRTLRPYYGGFYGPAYAWGVAGDPFWWGMADPLFDPYPYPYTASPEAVTGGLRLEVTPTSAQVFVDGAYAGIVDDFNGHFQHLNLTPGGHHIQITAAGFQTQAFDAYIQPDHTTDYKANMVPTAGPDE